MTLRHWILDEHHQLVEVDMLTWARWSEDIDNRRVALTQVTPDICVSTVFLGLDHRFSGSGPPLLFETMTSVDTGRREALIPGGIVRDVYDWPDCVRYATWAEAQIGHNAMVETLRKRVRQIDALHRMVDEHEGDEQ